MFCRRQPIRAAGGMDIASGRHDQGCAICTALSSSAPAHESVGPPLGACVDRYDQGCVPSAPPCSCRCSSTEQLGHLQVPWFDTTLAEPLRQKWHSLQEPLAIIGGGLAQRSDQKTNCCCRFKEVARQTPLVSSCRDLWHPDWGALAGGCASAPDHAGRTTFGCPPEMI